MNTYSSLTAQLLYPLILVSVLIAAPGGAIAADDDQASAQQHPQTQAERKDAQKARSIAFREAVKEFRDFSKALEREYREKLRDMDTQFDLKRVDIEAQHESREAEARVDYQRRTSELLRQPGLQYDAKTVGQLWGEWKKLSDDLFDLRKQFALELHNERIAHEQRKNALLTERDNEVLAEAQRLGLTAEYEPILAAPTGEELTQKEERWNDRERKKVAQIHERAARLLHEHKTGERLRAWEIENLQEDFELEWREKSELHALDTEQLFLNTMIMQQTDGEVDRHTFGDRFAELIKERELVEIEYDRIRKQNAIKRREEKRDLTSP